MVMDASSFQPHPRGLFFDPDPAATRRTKYGWVPRARGINLNFTCVLFLSISLRVPFIFIPPSPERSTVPSGLQLRGNIFTFPPSFSWPSYIRRNPAAQGKEVEGGGNYEFVTTKTPSSFLPCCVSLSTIHCHRDKGRLSQGRAAETQTCPLLLQKN